MASEHERLRMDAYYFGFAPTGVIEVDRILSAVATAGKGFHHTEDWTEPMSWHGGKSHEDLIQEAANAAAAAFRPHPTAHGTTEPQPEERT